MISYNPFRKTLVDLKMRPDNVRQVLGLSPNTMSKISNDKYIDMRNIDRICGYLSEQLGRIIDISEVIEYVQD